MVTITVTCYSWAPSSGDIIYMWHHLQAATKLPETSVSLLVHVTYMCALLFVHTPFVVNCTFNTTPTERLQLHALLFAMNRTYRTFFLWRFHLAPPSHPDQRTILLWLEKPSSKCSTLHTVAANNNREPTSCSFYFCFFAPRIYGCCYSRTSHSWWITHSAQS